MKTINYTDYSPFSMVQLQDELSRNSETFLREREKDREAEILAYLDNINFRIQKAWMNEQNGLVLKVNESLYDTHKLKSELESLVTLNYRQRAKLVLSKFLTDYTDAELDVKTHADELEKKLFNANLGSYTTRYAAGGNRGANVANAASRINNKKTVEIEDVDNSINKVKKIEKC